MSDKEKKEEEKGVDHLVAKEKYVMEVPSVKPESTGKLRMAPQDMPEPEPDPTKLPPKGTYVNDDFAQLVLHNTYAQPKAGSLGDVVLAMESSYKAREATALVRIFWKSLKPGSCLFIPADFPVLPVDVNPARAHVEGYKKYTK